MEAKVLELQAKLELEGKAQKVTANFKGKWQKRIQPQRFDLIQGLVNISEKMPAVMIAPDDVAIITGGSEERRKLFDAITMPVERGIPRPINEV
jgi:DNA replication and repair protein RecF